jgi:hypothetical protein
MESLSGILDSPCRHRRAGLICTKFPLQSSPCLTYVSWASPKQSEPASGNRITRGLRSALPATNEARAAPGSIGMKAIVRPPEGRPRARVSCLSAANVDGVAAIDSELRAIDVGRAIGRDECDGVGNLAHGPPAAGDDAPVTTGFIEELLF